MRKFGIFIAGLLLGLNGWLFSANAWPEQTCGYLAKNNEGQLAIIMQGVEAFVVPEYIYIPSAVQQHLDDALGIWGCVNYEEMVDDKYLLRASLASIKCPIYTRYAYDEAVGHCVACPKNTASQIFPTTVSSNMRFLENFYSNNLGCAYCMPNYYRVGTDTTSCTACPNGGKTDGDGHLGIERCYITPANGTDNTGTYVYSTGTRCYYK